MTPRFAITSSEAQLRVSGELLQSLDGVLMQTHLSESPGEIALVRELFPNARDYTDVYDRFGLLGSTQLLRAWHSPVGSANARGCPRAGRPWCIARRPTTSSAPASCAWRYLREARRPVNVGLATDVGGGTTYSMLATLGRDLQGPDAHGLQAQCAGAVPHGHARQCRTPAICRRQAPSTSAGMPISSCWTPAPRRSLPAVTNSQARLRTCSSALMILGDDRAVRATYIAGRKLHERVTQ